MDPANGNIKQTAQSPTIDKGNDALFFAEEEGPCCDFEGDPRPTDGDGDGHTVDIGADESPAFVEPPVGDSPRPRPAAQCVDGKDNDGDGATDTQGPRLRHRGRQQRGRREPQRPGALRPAPDSLVRADAKGKRVVLSGLVAGQVRRQDRSTISGNYGARRSSAR